MLARKASIDESLANAEKQGGRVEDRLARHRRE